MSKIEKNDYFGINKYVSAIIALFLSWVISPIVRILEGNYLAGILRLVLMFVLIGFLLDFIDCVLILLNGKILRVL